jgi:hypothetical protein
MPSPQMPLSRLMSAATLAYGVFALAKPRHLANSLEAPRAQAPAYDRLAYTFAGRDLAISTLGIAGPTRALVATAMGLRIAGDLADAATLGLTSKDASVRGKVLGATLGWATLNAVALAVDLRRG